MSAYNLQSRNADNVANHASNVAQVQSGGFLVGKPLEKFIRADRAFHAITLIQLTKNLSDH
ncbi:MAG TPA: hypothetical protein VHE99_08670 [Gammaproteobacteria bacterium]|nr:hypothetical protein [Gammaproteobacteria bacterium]